MIAVSVVTDRMAMGSLPKTIPLKSNINQLYFIPIDAKKGNKRKNKKKNKAKKTKQNKTTTTTTKKRLIPALLKTFYQGQRQ